MKDHQEYKKGNKKNPDFRNAKDNIHQDEWLTEETLYKWRKKTAIEIQFLTRTREEFYKLFLRNVN